MNNKNHLHTIFIEEELIDSYLNYALSVIIGRAIPDIRDGLKPVHRRTLFVMKELNNKFNKSYKKSARIVGDVIGKYHPHGEIAVYESIVRLTQTFIQRYPLIDGQGNFGSIDGDSAAAMRYTEIRMTEFSEYIIKDLDFSTVKYIFNYDNTEKYPSVFPSMIPNILLNGSYGIAVGMATNIPPHNFKEVINACLSYLNNTNILNTDLNKYVLSPDFPTFGVIHDINNITSIYNTGKGKFIIKATAIIHETTKDPYILIKELPYQTNKIKLLIKIKDLIKDKKIEGIKLIRDESDKDGLRIFILIDKNKNIKFIINKIYELSGLQSTFNINMLCIVKNIPKLLNLKNIIEYFILYRQEIIYNRIIHILSKIKYKIHLNLCSYIMLFNTYKIINLIKNVKSLNKLKNKINKINIEEAFFFKLKKLGFFYNNKKFNLSKLQTDKILNIKLSKLIKFEKNFTINSYLLYLKDYIYYKNFFSNNKNINNIIKKELIFLKNKFSDNRKTKIFKTNIFTIKKNIIEKKKILILLSYNGYLKIKDTTELKVQHRAGKGKTIFPYLKFNDKIININLGYNDEYLLCFSNHGRLYKIILSKIKNIENRSRGINISNYIKLNQEEKIITTQCININNNKNKYITIITNNGLIKITKLNNIIKIKNNGIKIIHLIKNDFVVDVKLINKDAELMIFSNVGRVIRFLSKKIKITGRQSQGVAAIKLNKNENIICLVIPEKNCKILTVTENGYGKCTKIEDYKITNRGGKGIITHKYNNKIGNIIAAEKIFKNNYLFITTSYGIIIQIKTKEIPCLQRLSKGVLLIKLKKNEKLINIKNDNEVKNETMYNN